MKTISTKIVKRSILQSRIVKRIYRVEIYSEDTLIHSTSHFTSPEKAISYLRSTGNTHNNIDVQYKDMRHIYLNNTTRAVYNGKTYSLFYKNEKIKNFRQWHKLQEFILSCNI